MDSMFNNLEVLCENENIEFKSINQRVRCLAHIINLATQDTLKILQGVGLESE